MRQALKDVKEMMEQGEEEVIELSEASLIKDGDTLIGDEKRSATELEFDNNEIKTDISEKTVKETAESFKQFIKTVEKEKCPQDNLGFRNGTLVEDLVKELLKPQITSWLDANLSSIVKTVVEKEVRKLIPKDD